MENASKALIIAGAILLSILIVSLGIMVYNNSKNTVGKANMNKQEIQTFNTEWEGYAGTNKTASEVKSMFQAVVANNAAETKNGTNRWISISNAETAPTDVPASAPTLSEPVVSNSKTYTIKCGYGSNGLVVSIAWNANT